MRKFLHLDKHEGDSTDEKYGKQIEVSEASWDVRHTNEGVPGTRQAQQAGTARFGTLKLTKPTDGASPKLVLTCAKGEHIEKGVLTVVGNDAARRELIKYTLTDVQVHSVQTVMEETGALKELVELRYAVIKGEYQTLDGKNTVAFEYDLRANP